jgi:hypothetical protein
MAIDEAVLGEFIGRVECACQVSASVDTVARVTPERHLPGQPSGSRRRNW